MNFFIQLIISAVLFVVSELIRPLPKTRDRDAIPFEEARLPSTSPQKPVHVGWGRFKISAPHLMGVTEYNTIAINTTVKTLFKSKEVTIGYRYLVGMYLGTGTGTCNVHQIYHGGILLWDRIADGFVSQSATAGDLISINEPDFLGGEENGGGLVGLIRFYRGDLAQIQDPYIQGFPDHVPTPAYRFTSYFVFQNFEVGESPALAEFEFVLDRSPPDFLALGANLRIDGKETDTEVNPMAIAADLLRNDNFGEGVSASELNIAVLNAMGDTLAVELNGMSLKWVQEESLSALFKIIIDQVQGVIFKKIGTGQWTGRLIRDDFDIETIRVVDESNIREMNNFSRRNWPETTNQAIIDWTDRDLDRKPTPAVEHDFSNFNRVGRVKTDRKTFPGVYSSELAVQIAVRALKSLTFPFANGDFIGDRTFFDAEPGEAMKLVWPKLGIVSLVIRVSDIGYGSSTNGDMPITFIEDFFSVSLADFTGLDDSVGAILNLPPQQILIIYGFQMPFFLQTQDTLVQPPIAAGSPVNVVNKLGWLAKRPQSNSLEWRMYEETSAGQPVVAQELSEFTPIGELTGQLVESTADEGVVIVIDTVSDSITMLESGFDTEANIKTNGFGLALFEDGTDEEWIGVTAVVDNGDGTFDVTIARGLIDTLPKIWPINSRLWFAAAAQGATSNIHGDADDISYQGENITTLGTGALSAIKSRVFTNRSDKPYPAGNFEITDADTNTSKYPTTPLPGGDITFDWEGRDRLTPDLLFQNDDGLVEAGFEFFMTIFNNTNPGSPVVLRRIGRGASGSPGTNEDINLTGEQYVWTEAKQIIDDPTGTISAIKVELRTLGNTLTPTFYPATLFNREDVARSFNRVIPLTAIGLYKTFILTEGPTAYWPLNGITPTETVSNINTTITGISSGLNRPLVRETHLGSYFFAGSTGNYVEADDDVAFDLSDTWSMEFWFAISKIRPSLNNNPLVIVRQSGSGNAPFQAFIIDDGSGDEGKLDISVRAVDAGGRTNIISDFRVDDGVIHHIGICQDVSGGNAPFDVYIDGMFMVSSASVGKPYDNADPYFIGGNNDAARDGIRGFVGHVSLWDSKLSADDWLNHYVNGERRGNYRGAVLHLLPKFYWPMHEWDDAGDVKNHGSNGVENLLASVTPTMRATGPLLGGQKSFAISYATSNTEFLISGTAAKRLVSSSGTMCYWFFADSVNPTTAWIFSHSSSGASNGEYRVIIIFTNPGYRFQLHIRHDNGTTFVDWLGTIDFIPADDAWHFITIRKNSGANRPTMSDNLREDTISIGSSGGAGGDSSWWNSMNADANYRFGVNCRASAASPTQINHGQFSEIAIYDGVLLTDEEVYGVWISGLHNFRSMTDHLLDFDPHHVQQIIQTAGAVPDLIGNIVDGTFNGTPDADQVGLVNEDPSLSVYFDDLAGTQERIDFTAPFLANSKGTGNFTDFANVVVGNPFKDNFATLVSNRAGAGQGNYRLQITGGVIDAFRYDKEPPANEQLETVNGTARNQTDLGRSFAVGVIEDGTATRRDITVQGAIMEYGPGTSPEDDPDVLETYTGAAVTTGKIGAVNDDTTTNDWGGLIQFNQWFDRLVDYSYLHRAHHRMVGHHEHILQIMQYTPTLLWRLNDPASSVLAGDHSTSINNGEVNGADGVFDNATDRSNLYQEDNGVWKGSATGDDDNISTITLPITGVATYPYTFGGWLRPDGTGVDDGNFIAFEDSADADSYLFVGFVSIASVQTLRLALANNTTEVNNDGSTVTEDTWHHVVCVANAANDIDVYLDGELDFNHASFATPTFTANAFIIGELSGANIAKDGSYHDVFVINSVGLNAEQVRVMYVKSKAPSVDNLILSETDLIAFWKLDDIDTSLRFRNHVFDVAASETIYATGTGLLQGQQGEIPTYPDNTADFDGTGNVDTNWDQYPSGANDWTLEDWIEGGSVGTIAQWGADSAGLAVIISVAANGDVTLNNHGTSILFTSTGLDTGTVHHFLMWYDGTNAALWVDGIQIGIDTAITLNVTATALNLLIGSDATSIGTADFNGKLGRVALYGAVLSDDSILVHATSGGV